MPYEKAKPAPGKGRATSKIEMSACNEQKLSSTGGPAAQAAIQIICYFLESRLADFLRGLASALIAGGHRV